MLVFQHMIVDLRFTLRLLARNLNITAIAILRLPWEWRPLGHLNR